MSVSQNWKHTLAHSALHSALQTTTEPRTQVQHPARLWSSVLAFVDVAQCLSHASLKRGGFPQKTYNSPKQNLKCKCKHTHTITSHHICKAPTARSLEVEEKKEREGRGNSSQSQGKALAIADVHLCRLQSVQNAAARLISGARRHDHITPILATLHRLPVRQRVIFKTATLVWKCVHDAAPRYLADLCVPAASTDGRRQSRSAVSGPLLVPWTRTSTGFAAYDPRTWN